MISLVQDAHFYYTSSYLFRYDLHYNFTLVSSLSQHKTVMKLVHSKQHDHYCSRFQVTVLKS